ncbi:hypothetical protein GGF46_004558 [Coemansia sp. RSA 552]|nr:hypothetical protein GGF46_004558 [Coemansia sp. RSA 552]
MPFDSTEALYTDKDPAYRATPLTSGIPPPSLSVLPRQIRNARGDGNYSGSQKQFRKQQPYPQTTPQQQMRRHDGHRTGDRDGVASRGVVDLNGGMLFMLANTRRPELAKQLATPDWSRMMSERDDVRGRRPDARLCDLALLQEIHKRQEALAGTPPDHHVATASSTTDQYAAVTLKCALGRQATLLGHLDFLLQPVREYLRPGKTLHYVDLGSEQCGFSHYIRWRLSQQAGAVQARGWYFGPPSSAVEPVAPTDGLSVVESAEGVLDPAAIGKFVAQVQEACADGVELVVAAAGNTEPGALDTSTEQQHYAYLIAQAAIALRLLRRGGTFVFRALETVTPLSAELLFLVHACFERVAIVRSLASLPSSPERFVVCNHLTADPRWVASHLLSALAKMHAGQLKPSHLVSWTRVSAERQFIDPLRQSNLAIAQAQYQALGAAASLAKQPQSPPGQFTRQQTEVANACLRHWGLPASTSQAGT